MSESELLVSVLIWFVACMGLGATLSLGLNALVVAVVTPYLHPRARWQSERCSRLGRRIAAVARPGGERLNEATAIILAQEWSMAAPSLKRGRTGLDRIRAATDAAVVRDVLFRAEAVLQERFDRPCGAH